MLVNYKLNISGDTIFIIGIISSILLLLVTLMILIGLCYQCYRRFQVENINGLYLRQDYEDV
jgi:hypothetical protein